MKLQTLNIEYLKNKALILSRSCPVRRARRIIKILERDNYKCIKCGSKDNLTIDHPEGRKFAKYDNHQKYNPSKCVTLCEKCHIKKNEEGINESK
jgi:5-methylcytosine-specific restriction endonuclease McrA